MPKISIALGAYNGSRYLKAQLDSFLNQKRLPDELVVSDDASTDQTGQILKDFAESAPFEVRINHNPVNLGVSKNFELAISLCRGDYIFLSDQDDIWLPEKIQELAGYLDDHSDCGLVFCNALIGDYSLQETGAADLWESLWFNTSEQKKAEQGRLFEVLLKHSVAAGMAMAFRSKYVPLIMPFPDVFSCHDHWPALLISAVSKTKCLDKKLVHYRIHDSEHQLIGIRKLNLLEQYQEAKAQLKMGGLSAQLKLNEILEERLSEAVSSGLYSLRPNLFNLIQQKQAHMKTRIELRQHKKLSIKKLGMIGKEAVSGRYARYSYGYKSVLQDLFL